MAYRSASQRWRLRTQKKLASGVQHRMVKSMAHVIYKANRKRPCPWTWTPSRKIWIVAIAKRWNAAQCRVNDPFSAQWRPFVVETVGHVQLDMWVMERRQSTSTTDPDDSSIDIDRFPEFITFCIPLVDRSIVFSLPTVTDRMNGPGMPEPPLMSDTYQIRRYPTKIRPSS